MLQEDLYSEIVECGAEKYRRQISRPDLFQIKTRACPVQKFHFLAQLLRGIAAQNNVVTLTSLDTVRMLLDVLEEVTMGISTIDAE
jgi:hypothetical protein